MSIDINKIMKIGICAGMVLPLTGCSKEAIVLKEDSYALEYGDSLNTDVKTYLNTEDMNKEDVDKVTMDTSALTVGEGKKYPEVGEYTVTFKYGDETKEMKVTVSDTTKPVFKDFKTSLEYTKDCKPKAEDLAKLFKAEDLSKTTITVDDSAVDYTKEGTYKATVTATDKSGNTESKETTVKIVKPTIKLSKTSISLYVKTSQVLDVTIKGKDTKATFKSSNTSVATVSDSGKITAKKAGTATITATANGVSATCKVTVKKAPSGSKTTTKTVTNKKTGKKETVTVIQSKPLSKTPRLSKEAFNLINAERKKAGVPALQWSSSLAKAAKIRAKECTVKYSHIRPNGTGPRSLGIDSEVLAGGINAKDAVNRWMNSSGHRKILLDPELKYCAVASIDDPIEQIWVGCFQL